MELADLADVLLIILMIGSFTLTYVENYELGCFRTSSFLISVAIFTFSYVYGRFLIKIKKR